VPAAQRHRGNVHVAAPIMHLSGGNSMPSHRAGPHSIIAPAYVSGRSNRRLGPPLLSARLNRNANIKAAFSLFRGWTPRLNYMANAFKCSS
jgi:hypothetical protein